MYGLCMVKSCICLYLVLADESNWWVIDFHSMWVLNLIDEGYDCLLIMVVVIGLSNVHNMVKLVKFWDDKVI